MKYYTELQLLLKFILRKQTKITLNYIYLLINISAAISEKKMKYKKYEMNI